MSVVTDSSPLIILSKLERVELLEKLFGQIIVTPCVWEETVTQGKAIGSLDAAYFEKAAIEHQFIRANLTKREKELTKRFSEAVGIDLGEAEVLTIAKVRKATAILDDKAARAMAIGLGVIHIGTVGLLFEAFLHRILSYQELVGVLQELGRVAWISPEVLTGILRKAGEVENK